MAPTKGKTAATQVYIATTSFNEFEAGQTYELRASDAQKWLDKSYLRPADAEQIARFGGDDASAVHDEGTPGPTGSGSGTGS